MEWLMGKARGVSRNIISGSSSQSSSSMHTTLGGSPCSGSSSDPNASGSPPPAYTEAHYASQQLVLNSVDFDALVEPFAFINHNEWLAVHTIGLFDNISTLYDAVYELCACPIMTGPGALTYVATDDKGKKIKCSARQYMDSVLAQSLLVVKSAKYFPTRWGDPFPQDFRNHVIGICRNLFQVLVHLYAAHFSGVDSLELVPYLNTIAKHFFFFNAKFSLVDEKEVEVLGDLFSALVHYSPSNSPAFSQQQGHGDAQGRDLSPERSGASVDLPGSSGQGEVTQSSSVPCSIAKKYSSFNSKETSPVHTCSIVPSTTQ